MIVDFHTHVFPEKIAAGTISQLEKVGGIKAFTNGTLEGLKDSMVRGGVDYSVVLPVVTKPAQFPSIQQYAEEINQKDGIISFGGIHPNSLNPKEELEIIKKSGLKGLKLHPDYQKTFINDDKYINIIKTAIELNLIVVIHAGLDIGLPNPIHCPPSRSRDMLQKVNKKKAKIVLAHTGGYDHWDDVEKYLVGQEVYFDISYTLHRIGQEQLIRIIRKHGVEKILFATDSPWGGQRETIERFYQLPLTKDEQERILWKNAFELLEIEKP